VIGRFVDAARCDEPCDDLDASDDLYEYLVNHELSFEGGRRYHICSAHPEARAALRAGRIPAGFRCPLANEACPMRAILRRAPGCDVRLSIGRRCSGALPAGSDADG
jgi:hypothetical protein